LYVTCVCMHSEWLDRPCVNIKESGKRRKKPVGYPGAPASRLQAGGFLGGRLSGRVLGLGCHSRVGWSFFPRCHRQPVQKSLPVGCLGRFIYIYIYIAGSFFGCRPVCCSTGFCRLMQPATGKPAKCNRQNEPATGNLNRQMYTFYREIYT